MEIRLIACGKVEFPKLNKDSRDFDMGVAKGIARSIKEEGMLHPIGVRVNPDKPGYYLGVQGRHRLYAKDNLLKEELIECNVLDMGDQEAEMATVTENLFRHNLSQAQKTRAVKLWREIYIAKHPELVGKGKAGGAAMKKKAECLRKAKANLTFASEGETGEERAKAEGVSDKDALSFAKTLAAVTGVSDATAKREQRLAANLTEEQILVCEKWQLSKGQMESIANIRDEKQRAELVDLIDFGLEFDDAWDQANPKAKKATGKSREREATEAATEREQRPDLSDDAWFDRFCGEKAALLGSLAGFKADALIFRRITGPRYRFRAEVKGTLNDAKRAKVTGPFYESVERFVSEGHPKDWPLCNGCAGSGVDGSGVGCTTCRGAGYLLKSPPAGPTTVVGGDRAQRTTSPVNGAASSVLVSHPLPDGDQACAGKPGRSETSDPRAADREAGPASTFAPSEEGEENDWMGSYSDPDFEN